MLLALNMEEGTLNQGILVVSRSQKRQRNRFSPRSFKRHAALPPPKFQFNGTSFRHLNSTNAIKFNLFYAIKIVVIYYSSNNNSEISEDKTFSLIYMNAVVFPGTYIVNMAEWGVECSFYDLQISVLFYQNLVLSFCNIYLEALFQFLIASVTNNHNL